MEGINRIVVITLSNIGDVVLTLPVIGALNENFMDAAIDVVVGPRAKEIFEADPRIGKMYIYDKSAPLLSKIKLLGQLRRNRYDIIIDLRNSFFGFFAGARFCSKPAKISAKEVKHKVEEHLDRIRELGIKAGTKPYPVWIPREDLKRSTQLLSMKGIKESDDIICVSPGAKSHIKRWRESGFSEVCDALIDFYKLKVVFVGDSSDKEICERILSRMKNYAVSVAGLTNLRELAAIISRSKLVITNDSAPLHIAGSLGIPAVAIFGPTDYRKYGPREGLGEAVFKRLHCAPCETALCRYNLECMQSVNVEDVIDSAKTILNGRREKNI